ncbi:hypothetical protein A0H81_05619 [Grifola frondosa]|uniref:F-box domain-containing protein n=1 Tax=Grifola frondosa TaxID=5627 RepID=A0A1C7MCU6_GRIFR|nr:hypothetical protein A0H81_05619 [Grifola frondosa]
MAEIQNIHLCSFPEELLIKILLDVELRDILAIKRACRLLAELVENALELQYKVALGKAGLENGPPGNLTTAERLEKVKQYQDAWHSMNFIVGDPFELPPHSLTKSHSGGVYSLLTTVGDVKLYRISSPIRGRPEQHWTLTRHDMDLSRLVQIISVCDVDCSQDLVVLLHTDSINIVGIRSYAIHLRSATTGAQHPLASRRKLKLPHKEAMHDSSIYGDIVAVVTLQSQTKLHLLLWNWKSGTMIFHLESTFGATISPRCYTFVDEQHIMVTGRSHLAVYRFHPAATMAFHPLPSRDEVCILQLPSFSSFRAAAVNIHFNWSQVPSVMQPGIPFQNDLANSVVMLQISLGRAGPPCSYLCLSMSAVRSYIQQASVQTKSFTWEQWGPMGSRMIILSPTLYQALGTLGSRCLFIRRSAGAGDELHLVSYECHPWAVGDTHVAEGQAAQTTFMDHLSTMPEETAVQYSVFADYVHTYMPYRVTISREKLPPGFRELGLWSEDGFAFRCRSASDDDVDVMHLAPLCPTEQLSVVRAGIHTASSE